MGECRDVLGGGPAPPSNFEHTNSLSFELL